MICNCRSLQVRTYESKGIRTNHSSPIDYIGNLENINWIEGSLLKNYQLTGIQKIPFWNYDKEINRNISRKTVTVLDINRSLVHFLPSGGFTSYPWIRQVVYLDSGEYKKRRRNIMAEFRRLMKKHEYSAGITSSRKDIDFFYRHLYLPFVDYKFQSTAHPRSHYEISRAVKKGFILQIFYKGGWIAGDIVRFSGDEIQGIASGLLPDYREPSRRTARTVMYPILFEWAQSNGYRKINLLRSRANLRDGVFASKKHRGAIAEVDSWPHSALRFYIPENTLLPEFWKTQLVLKNDRLTPLEEILNE
jgi:hypothetical protein